jgi:hypothetical protein
METCKVIPFLNGETYCYGPVWLSHWDRVFYIILISALMAVAINYIQDRE